MTTTKETKALPMKENTKEKEKLTHLDFNADLAQGFGRFTNEREYEMLDYVSSVNIACGFHSGDAVSIRKALLACKDKNVAIGAHIGFDDLQGFGLRAMELTDEELEALVIYQVGAIASFASSYGLELEHVRPHGAMYRLAAKDFEFSLKIANAIAKFDKWLIYYGAGTEVLTQVSEAAQIRVAHEFCLDKVYNSDATIDYEANDIVNTSYSVNRLKRLIDIQEIENNQHGKTPVVVDSIHFNSSASNALELVKQAHEIISPVPVNYNRVHGSGWL